MELEWKDAKKDAKSVAAETITNEGLSLWLPKVLERTEQLCLKLYEIE